MTFFPETSSSSWHQKPTLIHVIPFSSTQPVSRYYSQLPTCPCIWASLLGPWSLFTKVLIPAVCVCRWERETETERERETERAWERERERGSWGWHRLSTSFSSEMYKRPFTTSLQRGLDFQAEAKRWGNFNKQAILANPREFAPEKGLNIVTGVDWPRKIEHPCSYLSVNCLDSI